MSGAWKYSQKNSTHSETISMKTYLGERLDVCSGGWTHADDIGVLTHATKIYLTERGCGAYSCALWWLALETKSGLEKDLGAILSFALLLYAACRGRDVSICLSSSFKGTTMPGGNAVVTKFLLEALGSNQADRRTLRCVCYD